MTVRSPRHRKTMRNRSGYAALIATIIMVLVVLFLYFNVYMYTLDRNKDFQDVSSRSQQLDADRNSERVTISEASSTDGGGGFIVISCTLINSGSVPTQIVRLWLQDYSIIQAPNVGSIGLLSQNIVLQPGAMTSQTFTVFLPSASADDAFVLRIVTSRANVVVASIN